MDRRQREYKGRGPELLLLSSYLGARPVSLSSAEIATKAPTSCFLCLYTHCIKGARSPVFGSRVWGRGTQITRQQKSVPYSFISFFYRRDSFCLQTEFSHGELSDFMCFRRYSCILFFFPIFNSQRTIEIGNFLKLFTSF
jgi:hypothetical protein